MKKTIKGKTIEISVPKTLDDFKVKHARMLIQLSTNPDEYKPTMLNKCKHVSMYSGVSIDEIKRMDVNDINKVFNHCMNELSKYVKQEPPKEIKLNGQIYELIEIENQSANWLIDYEVDNELFRLQPEKWVAMAYIEKGTKYDDAPNDDREQIFLEHFPARVMFDLADFFLTKYENYMNATVLIQTTKLKVMKWKAKRKRIHRTSK